MHSGSTTNCPTPTLNQTNHSTTTLLPVNQSYRLLSAKTEIQSSVGNCTFYPRSKISTLPNYKKTDMGKNLSFVTVFQTI